MIKPLQRTSGLILGTLAGAAVFAGCDNGSETARAIDEELPAGARIGNVATAELSPVGDSSVSGTATFAEVEDGIRIEVSVSGLASGEHGVHLHEFGNCSAPDASSAGGHWSPAGDFGNLTAGPDGAGSLERRDSELALVGDYGVVGKSVIVHAGSDDLETDPGGDAGRRIACGVIEWGTELD